LQWANQIGLLPPEKTKTKTKKKEGWTFEAPPTNKYETQYVP